MTVSELRVLVTGDISGLQRALTSARSEMNSFSAAAASGGGGGSLFSGLLGGGSVVSDTLTAAGRALDAFGDQLESLGARATAAGAKLTIALTAPLILIGKHAIQSAADFEQAMNVLGATSDTTAAQVQKLRDEAIRLGADTRLPGTSALDAAHALLELRKAGLSVTDALAAGRPTALLAAAAHIQQAEAAKTVASELHAFQLPGTEATRITNLLAAATNSSTATIGEMALGLQQSSAVAHMFGMSLDDTVASLTMMANAGVRGSDAGTSLKTMLERLFAPTDEAKSKMAELGIHTFDASGHYKTLTQVIAEFSRALGPTATITRAVGGDVDEMQKALVKAQKAGKEARNELEKLPATLKLQQVELDGVKRKLGEVGDPALKLSEVVRHQTEDLNELTKALVKARDEGLHKLGREADDVKGKILETTLEIGLQQKELEKLEKSFREQTRTGQIRGGTQEYEEKELAIVQLTNRIRENKENIVDWNRKLADNARQQREGIDGIREKQEQITHLSASLEENKKKLIDVGGAEKALATSKLETQIVTLTQAMKENQEKLAAAPAALAALTKAQENAQLVTRQMTDQDRAAALQKIFGTDAIRAANIILLSHQGELEKTRKKVQDMGAAQRLGDAQMKGLNGAIEGLKSSLDTLAVTVGSRFLPVLKQGVDFLTQLSERFGRLSPEAQGAAIKLAGLAAAFGPALLAVGPLLGVLGSLSGILGGVVTWGGTLAKLLGGPLGIALAAAGVLVLAYKNNWLGLRDAVQPAVEWLGARVPKALADIQAAIASNGPGLTTGLTQAFTQIGSAARSFADFIGPYLVKAFAGVRDVAVPVWNEISRFLQNIWPPIVKITADSWNTVTNGLRAAFGVLRALFKGTFDDFVNVVRGAWLVIQGTVKIAWGLVAGFIETGLKLLSGDWQGAWESVKHYTKVVWSGVGDIVHGSILEIIGYVTGAAKLLFNAGTAMLQGLIDGIKSGAASVVNAIVGVVQNAIAAAKAALGIASPSAVFAEIGQQVAAGYAKGIQSGTGLANSALAGLLGSSGQSLAFEGGAGAGYMTNSTRPVESGPRGGGGNVTNNVHMTVVTQDAQSFRQSRQQVQQDLHRTIRYATGRNQGG